MIKQPKNLKQFKSLIKREAKKAWRDAEERRGKDSGVWFQGYAAALDWVACYIPEEKP